VVFCEEYDALAVTKAPLAKEPDELAALYAAFAWLYAPLARSNAGPGSLPPATDALIVIVFVVVLVLMVILLPATKDKVSEPLPANIRELFELIVSNENWLEMYDVPPRLFL